MIARGGKQPPSEDREQNSFMDNLGIPRFNCDSTLCGLARLGGLSRPNILRSKGTGVSQRDSGFNSGKSHKRAPR